MNSAPDHLIVSSRILQTELTRVLRRERRPVAERDLVLEKVAMTPVTEAVLMSAEAISGHVRTLDAIHLASALAVGSDVLVSHDAAVKRFARILDLHVLDPLAAHRSGA